MNFTQIVNWCHQMSHTSDAPPTADTDPSLLQASEVIRKCFRKDFISNVSQISYLCDTESDDITTADINEHLDNELPAEEPQPVAGEEPEAEPEAEAEPEHQTQAEERKPKKWSLFKFNLESRKFNLDLTPRVIKRQPFV